MPPANAIAISLFLRFHIKNSPSPSPLRSSQHFYLLEQPTYRRILYSILIFMSDLVLPPTISCSLLTFLSLFPPVCLSICSSVSLFSYLSPASHSPSPSLSPSLSFSPGPILRNFSKIMLCYGRALPHLT